MRDNRMCGMTAYFAWRTEDRETGDRWDHFKTIRESDGVVIGEHVEKYDTFGTAFRIIWGRCDLRRATSADPMAGFAARPILHKGK